MLNNLFTIIVPTHNRHSYLKRSIKYFKNLDQNVIFCDSSNISYDGDFEENMHYLHLPGKSFAEKVVISIKNSNSPIIALCADDDFIVFNSLHKGYNHLIKNEKINTILGKNIFFYENFNNIFYEHIDQVKNEKVINYDPYTNATIFFKNYKQILWGMFRKKTILKSFEIIQECKLNNDNFIEFIIGAICCHDGGIKFLDDILNVREMSFNEHWGDRHEKIKNPYESQFKIDYKVVKKIVDKETNEGFTDFIIKNYLKLSFFKKIKLWLKIVIKKFLSKYIISFFTKKKKLNKVEIYSSNKKILNKMDDLIKSDLSEIYNILKK